MAHRRIIYASANTGEAASPHPARRARRLWIATMRRFVIRAQIA